jgi:ABC-type polysaccharide/polyol phosphate export permease
VLAFGVLWEVIEFLVGTAAASLGFGSVLTQYGLEDTVLDMFYNSIGGLLVAVFGSARLSGISRELADKLDARSANR